MSDLAKILREELAMNPHNDDEANLRCVCVECVAALVELGVVVRPELRDRYEEVSKAAYWLPVPADLLDTAPMRLFRMALHRLHVAVSP